MSDLEVIHRKKGGDRVHNRRHFVNPQPKPQASERDGPRGRRRLRTSGDAVSTKAADDQESDAGHEGDEDMEDKGSVRTHGSGREDDRRFPEEKKKPLDEVINRVADEEAQDALERLRTRQLVMERRLMSVEYLGRAQQEELGEVRVLVGPCLRVFPPKGSTAAWVRQQLSTAFWAGSFGQLVTRIVSEFGVPYTLGLASHSCEQEVANICRQKVPYCWPMLYNSTKVGLQEAQCHDARAFLKQAADRYAEQDGTDSLKFLYVYPMERRKLNADGKLSDDDDWSVEVIFPDIGATEVLMVCLYDHENCTQRYVIDARVIWDMTWTEEDLESCVKHIVMMYKPCVEFIVETDDPKLSIRGKRRFKQSAKGQKGKGEGFSGEEPVDRTNNGIGKAGGIPESMRGFGTGGKNGGGKSQSKQSVGGGKPFGKQAFRKGDTGFGKGKPGQQFNAAHGPIGVDGGFAPGATNMGQSVHHGPYHPQPSQQFNPMDLMQQFFSQAMGKGKSYIS